MSAQDTEKLAQMTAVTYADEGDDKPRQYIFTSKQIPTLRPGERIRVMLYREHTPPQIHSLDWFAGMLSYETV